ncbi:vomeronasal type-1 receptor 1-like [Hyaena hyaena]|uniref:vomeronasal type-1 receptor 1-like n=1 Tax=Hyaena hyaena TaxID=95912 RepID=UPI001923FD78|nr:vomeronasal type-1 receptor 1-like [Hyaena hyaena]
MENEDIKAFKYGKTTEARSRPQAASQESPSGVHATLRAPSFWRSPWVLGSYNLEMGIIFLVQVAVGILGNSLLFGIYTFTLLTGHQLKPKDLILNQLVLANNLVLFSKGIPQTMAAFGRKSFLDNPGCKVVFYVHRVGRGVSLSITCLLSGYQASKLHSNISGVMGLRISPKCIGFCCFLCWILHLLLNIYIPMKVTEPENSKNLSLKNVFVYCSRLPQDKLIGPLNVVTYFFFDFVCLSIMVWASGSMVLVLLRHKQRVQHIHSHSLYPRPSHEARATCTILILASSFVCCYCLSSILSLCLVLIMSPKQWLVNTSVFVASCFPTFSPFVLISSEMNVSQFCFACWTRKTKFLNLVKQLYIF